MALRWLDKVDNFIDALHMSIMSHQFLEIGQVLISDSYPIWFLLNTCRILVKCFYMKLTSIVFKTTISCEPDLYQFLQDSQVQF